jgi:hypothetical protein
VCGKQKLGNRIRRSQTIQNCANIIHSLFLLCRAKVNKVMWCTLRIACRIGRLCCTGSVFGDRWLLHLNLGRGWLASPVLKASRVLNSRTCFVRFKRSRQRGWCVTRCLRVAWTPVEGGYDVPRQINSLCDGACGGGHNENMIAL